VACDEHLESDLPLVEQRAPDQHQELLAASHLAGGRARWHYAAQAEGLAQGKQWVDPATSVNFRAFRRTCATWFQKVGTTKDIQAQLRHTTPMTTLGVYVQELPESVRTAVEVLDQKLCGLAVAQPSVSVQ